MVLGWELIGAFEMGLSQPYQSTQVTAPTSTHVDADAQFVKGVSLGQQKIIGNKVFQAEGRTY